jgi:hypothetical protein
MSAELRPCAHCASAYLVVLSEMYASYVECQSCYDHGPRRSTRQEAIDAWNRRADDPAVAKLVEALEWYAKDSNYSTYTRFDTPFSRGVKPVLEDHGDTARTALAEWLASRGARVGLDAKDAVVEAARAVLDTSIYDDEHAHAAVEVEPLEVLERRLAALDAAEGGGYEVIEIKHEPKGWTPPYPYESCCFCWIPTAYWHEPKDVAVCPECAAKHEAEEVPSKADWCMEVRQREALRRIATRDMARP